MTQPETKTLKDIGKLDRIHRDFIFYRVFQIHIEEDLRDGKDPKKIIEELHVDNEIETAKHNIKNNPNKRCYVWEVKP